MKELFKTLLALSKAIESLKEEIADAIFSLVGFKQLLLKPFYALNQPKTVSIEDRLDKLSKMLGVENKGLESILHEVLNKKKILIGIIGINPSIVSKIINNLEKAISNHRNVDVEDLSEDILSLAERVRGYDRLIMISVAEGSSFLIKTYKDSFKLPQDSYERAKALVPSLSGSLRPMDLALGLKVLNALPNKTTIIETQLPSDEGEDERWIKELTKKILEVLREES
ncbi:MAG TPA: hypothetical protein ENF80_04340 [Thermofilum sp.]|nr:hypothetical protein [Thermofilum sp.]